MDEHPTPEPREPAAPQDDRQWQPLDAVPRRVLGVLMEKAKTTPDNYPMSLAALVAGSNQKSNRSPQMQLDEDDVEAALDELRAAKAAFAVEGSGRVVKYRHNAYAWLDVGGPEAAVMAELLLRGPQTLGELRGRAARMEPFDSLAALQPVVESLRRKGLVVSLTPAGRGQVVTHNLYLPAQLEKVRSQFAGGGDASPRSADSGAKQRPHDSGAEAAAEMRAQLESLRQEVDELKTRLEKLEDLLT